MIIEGNIIKIAGPVIVADGMRGAQMLEMVRVGDEKLIGEIIELEGDTATIQVYEETAGIQPGEVVECTGGPLSVELGPGVMSSIFDGIQRPLRIIREESGDFIARGIDVDSVNIHTFLCLRQEAEVIIQYRQQSPEYNCSCS